MIQALLDNQVRWLSRRIGRKYVNECVAQVCALLVSNIERLDETVKEEADGVHNSLAIVENIVEFRPEVCKDVASSGEFSTGTMVI